MKTPPKPLNEFQKRLNEEATKMETMVNEMGDNAIDIKNLIDDGVEELNKLDA